ncbi:MAG TPA: hypothetical protein VEV21_12750 [Burkholderiales bacterium]|nr:hypothetical protein [Burkholderiales bacterium]
MKAKLLAASALLLAACAVQHPQNAQEFRQYVPASSFAKVQTFEANRPFREVAKTFQAKAPECLDVAVRTVETSSTSNINVLTTYKPTVVVTEKKAELHVQRSFKGNVIVPGKVPEGGDYFVVADATPLDRNRTRIDIYAPTMGSSTIIRAITGWATGENVGCPDMTKR